MPVPPHLVDVANSIILHHSAPSNALEGLAGHAHTKLSHCQTAAPFLPHCLSREGGPVLLLIPASDDHRISGESDTHGIGSHSDSGVVKTKRSGQNSVDVCSDQCKSDGGRWKRRWYREVVGWLVGWLVGAKFVELDQGLASLGSSSVMRAGLL